MAKENKKAAISTEERLEAALVSDWEQPYKVPANWCWTTVKTLCTLINGRAFKPTDWSESGLPIVRIQNLNNPEAEYNYYSGKVDPAHMLKGQELLFAWSGTPGTSFGAHIWWGTEAVLNQHIFKVLFNERCVNKTYLKYAINQQIEWLISVAHGGAGLQHVTKGAFESTPIPLPPLAEQQRIVERIESLFAKMDEAKEKAQKVIDDYDAYRAAILYKAFTGELTADWRKTTNTPISSWNRYKYGELGTSRLGKMLDKEKNTGRSIPYLRNVNVRWFAFDLHGVSTMLASETEIENLSIKTGDLFICEGGEPGRCAVWREQDAEMIFQKALHRFRPNEKVISEFLCYFLFYLSLNKSLDKYFTGTTIKHLTGKSLAEIEVIVPSVDEQAQIVNRLQHLFDTEQKVKSAAEQAIIRINDLKKYILTRAFRGELGTNNPTDGNAVELLKETLNIEKSPTKRAKAITIPKELSANLKTELEKKIVKLFFQKNEKELPIKDIMTVSSKLFDVLDCLRDLERRQLITKLENGNYRLMG